MSNSIAINSSSQSTYSTEQSNLPNNSIDKNAFLKILMIQLQNQDPLNPVQDKEFIAQMAQFSSLEQLQELNKQFSVNQSILSTISDSIKEQNSTYLEKINELNNTFSDSFNSLKDSFEGMTTKQTESINKDTEMINQLTNINKAIISYNPE